MEAEAEDDDASGRNSSRYYVAVGIKFKRVCARYRLRGGADLFL